MIASLVYGFIFPVAIGLTSIYAGYRVTGKQFARAQEGSPEEYVEEVDAQPMVRERRAGFSG